DLPPLAHPLDQAASRDAKQQGRRGQSGEVASPVLKWAKPVSGPYRSGLRKVTVVRPPSSAGPIARTGEPFSALARSFFPSTRSDPIAVRSCPGADSISTPQIEVRAPAYPNDIT